MKAYYAFQSPAVPKKRLGIQSYRPDSLPSLDLKLLAHDLLAQFPQLPRHNGIPCMFIDRLLRNLAIPQESTRIPFCIHASAHASLHVVSSRVSEEWENTFNRRIRCRHHRRRATLLQRLLGLHLHRLARVRIIAHLDAKIERLLRDAGDEVGGENN